MLFLKKIKSSPWRSTAHRAGMIRHFCDGKEKLSQLPARVYFHFPAWSAVGGAVQRRAREQLPREGCQEPRSPRPAPSFPGQLPGCSASPGDSLQAGPPFSPSPHPPSSMCQDKNAENMNGYEPLCGLFFPLKI